MLEDGLADRNKSGQGVADNMQAQETKPRLRKAGQLEWERTHFPPIDQPARALVVRIGTAKVRSLP